MIQTVIALGNLVSICGLVDSWSLRWISQEGGLGGRGTDIHGHGSGTLFCASKRKMFCMRHENWLFIMLEILCSPENGCVYLKEIELGGLRCQVEDLSPGPSPSQVTHMTLVLSALIGKRVKLRIPLAGTKLPRVFLPAPPLSTSLITLP